MAYSVQKTKWSQNNPTERVKTNEQAGRVRIAYATYEASAEQSEGIGQVNTAVHQMDQVTQQTAANAEETASASEELAAQAQTMKEQINILAMQVGGKTNGKLRKHTPVNPDKLPEQNVTDLKTSGNSIFKLIFSPICLLKSIVKLRKHNDSNKRIKSGPMGSSETASEVDNKAGGNGNGNKEDVLIETASNDSLIPMGENRIPEHDESFKDF